MNVQVSLWLQGLLHLFFPELCCGCHQALVDQEEILCMKCLLYLPTTNFHTHDDNPVSKIFWGRVPLEKATAFMYFNKNGLAQELMHQLKYKGRQHIGFYLGKRFGQTLKDQAGFDGLDGIVPVPLHPKKLKKRGFNQSLHIAKGLSVGLEIPCFEKQLIRSEFTSSQTNKSRYERWLNVKSGFSLYEGDVLIGKHLLLVDDVITTGATLEACAQQLLTIPEVNISVVSLAYAQV